jgi:MarR family transcriptional regulator, lower aerobic nicotinate degradation pathway regulator
VAADPAGPSARALPQIGATDGMAQLAFLVHGLLADRAAGQDLSVIQARLLGVLRDRRPTMNELARLLGLDKSSITGLVDRAERRGLVTRVASVRDRRSTQVVLTAAGRDLVSAAAAGFDADVTALLARLPAADRDHLADLVSRLLVAHAAAHGVDLFAGVAEPGAPAVP